MAADGFTYKDGRRLRTGRTTGSCAALAARAAAYMLLTGTPCDSVSITTPDGTRLTVPVRCASMAGGCATCAVQKDAGDDPDITNGVMIFATVRKIPEPGIGIDGGAGVGRVTKPGLDQPVGAAAINSVPRKMIAREIRDICAQHGYSGGIGVVISIPDGERLAKQTFNPHLGIEGGLSVIGTTGIVHPMSTDAVVDTIAAQLSVLRAAGARMVLAVPGAYGLGFVKTIPELLGFQPVLCSNCIGQTVDLAASMGFPAFLLAGHIGKLIKLAGGIMDTHSRTADARLDLLALHAGLAGAPASLMRGLLGAVTVDDGLRLLAEAGIREAVLASLLGRIEMYLCRRAGAGLRAGVLLFGGGAVLLGMTDTARLLLEEMKGTPWVWQHSGGSASAPETPAC